MRKLFTQATLSLAALCLIAAPASAQQIVHALAGKITAINPATNTIEIATDDGSAGVFDVLTKDTDLSFQKDVRALTVPARAFTKTNDQVLVFFFGDDSVRTSVALEDLGATPLTSCLGTVVRFDKHHQITIKDASGKEETFQVDARTIGDATYGVTEAGKFSLDKGTQVRIVATNQNGALTALFIRALSL